MSMKKYVSALRFRWLTPLYDFIVGLTMPENKIKTDLIATANINAGTKLLDFGCGTATLPIMIKKSCPQANITGIDIDRGILDVAGNKIKQENLNILLLQYNGYHLPFQRNAFDRVISCLVFHHLDTDTKRNILLEIFRVMDKNGQLHIADFGRSKIWIQRKLFNIIRVFDGFNSTEANAKGLLPQLIAEAGFEKVGIRKRVNTIFGEVQLISAQKV